MQTRDGKSDVIVSLWIFLTGNQLQGIYVKLGIRIRFGLTSQRYQLLEGLLHSNTRGDEANPTFWTARRVKFQLWARAASS